MDLPSTIPINVCILPYCDPEKIIIDFDENTTVKDVRASIMPKLLARCPSLITHFYDSPECLVEFTYLCPGYNRNRPLDENAKLSWYYDNETCFCFTLDSWFDVPKNKK